MNNREMPETIWAAPYDDPKNGGEWSVINYMDEPPTKYTRADITDDLVKALENAAQVFCNLHNAEPKSPNDWKFHLGLTMAAIAKARGQS